MLREPTDIRCNHLWCRSRWRRQEVKGTSLSSDTDSNASSVIWLHAFIYRHWGPKKNDYFEIFEVRRHPNIQKTYTKGVVPVISTFVNLCSWVAKHCESIQPTRCDIKLHIIYYQYILWKLNVFAIFHILFPFRRTSKEIKICTHWKYSASMEHDHFKESFRSSLEFLFWPVSNAASRDGQLDETGEAYVPVSKKGHDLAILRPSLQEAPEVRPFVKLTESVHASFNFSRRVVLAHANRISQMTLMTDSHQFLVARVPALHPRQCLAHGKGKAQYWVGGSDWLLQTLLCRLLDASNRRSDAWECSAPGFTWVHLVGLGFDLIW